MVQKLEFLWSFSKNEKAEEWIKLGKLGKLSTMISRNGYRGENKVCMGDR